MCPKIVLVFPQFTSIPPFDSLPFVPFCWNELILYKTFHSLRDDIGTTSFEITSHLNHIKDTSIVWHVECVLEYPSTLPYDDSTFDPIPFPLPHTMVEWELISQICPRNDMHIYVLEMLGHRDFENNHNWTHDNNIHDTFA